VITAIAIANVVLNFKLIIYYYLIIFAKYLF